MCTFHAYFVFVACSDNFDLAFTDMGLGKTVQMLALLSALLLKTGTHNDYVELKRRRQLAHEWVADEESRRNRMLEQGRVWHATDASQKPELLPSWAPVLILAPSSILDNWIGDGKTWGHFQMTIYQSKDDYSGINEIRNGACEILLVSHKLFEMENHFAVLNEIPWKLVVVDEHHRLKNPKSKATTNLRVLRDDHCAPVLGLTGTVMQNNHKGTFLFCFVFIICIHTLRSLTTFHRAPLSARSCCQGISGGLEIF
jgi:SNF2 family DNA or RNA helicase